MLVLSNSVNLCQAVSGVPWAGRKLFFFHSCFGDSLLMWWPGVLVPRSIHWCANEREERQFKCSRSHTAGCISLAAAVAVADDICSVPAADWRCYIGQTGSARMF